MRIADIDALDRALVVGSFLRKDHPLIASRIRLAARRGQQVNVLHVADDDLAIRVANKSVVRPGELPAALGQVVKALAEEKGMAVPAAVAGLAVGAAARAMAKSLASGTNVGILLGNSAQQHPRASQLHALAQDAARLAGARFGFLGEAANSVGGYLARCVPGTGGLNAAAMLDQPRNAYLLLNVEPELDAHRPRQAGVGWLTLDGGGVRGRGEPRENVAGRRDEAQSIRGAGATLSRVRNPGLQYRRRDGQHGSARSVDSPDDGD